ncbi:MAG: S8 family serine peptidase, partial [Rhodoferax sp.]
MRSTDVIRVGVVDTGFVVEHPEYAEFAENFQVFSAGARADTNTSTIQDTEDPHGTYVTQVIAGKTTGFVKATGDASLLLAKATPIDISSSALYTDYVLDTRDILAGTVWAIDRGARIMNYSLAPMYLLDSDLRTSYEYALSRNVAMVISAGNDGENLTTVTANTPSLFSDASLRKITLVVGAVQNRGGELVLASYSNHAGSSTDIQSRFLVAQDPVMVRSQFPSGGTYTDLLAYGTSFTAPQVAAALTSLLVRWPHLGAATSTQILLDTADQSFSNLYNLN